MATAIFFNGRRIVVPQAVSKVDASALQAVSPGAVGIVALIGTAEGGKPLTVDLDNDLTRPDAVRTQYRDGDLKKAALFCFEPSQDDAVPGGASRIVPVKVNPSTQSTLTLPDDDSNDAVVLTSVDYGQFTEQINVDVQPGTTQGKSIALVFESLTEAFDDIGGDSIMSLLYAPGAEGYGTATGRITSTQFLVAATKAEAGLTAELTDPTPAGLPAGLEALSSAAGDTTQSLTIYGLVGTTPTKETIALDGTNAVPTSVVTWSKVLGAVLSAATVGTVTLRVAGGGATALQLAPATLARGVVLTTNTPAAGPFTVSIDVDTAVDVALFGTNAAGAEVAERFDMTAGATTPVVGATTFGTLAVIALGDVAAARTITLSVNAAVTSHSVFPTIQKVVDRLNALDGFTATALKSDAATFLMEDADYSPAVSLVGAAANFYADLDAFITAINEGSQLVTAERASGASLVPADTATPLYLSGGIEGTVTSTQWQQAFTLLKKRRVTTIVPLTRDPAIHSLLLSHLLERAGRLRSEANGIVGVGTAGGAGETLANIRTQIQALNTRHISAVVQEMQRFDPDTLEATWYPPYILAAQAAGMQAGSAIGEPLTRKIINALDLRNDSSWSVEDDIDTLIDSGAMVAEKVDGVGIRWVRSVTTHLQDDNLVFTELSANESANTAVFELRTALDEKIGDRALASSAGVVKSLAADTLDRLVKDEIIAAWRPETLVVEQIGDVFPVSVEIAPVVPINFIPVTVHLVPLRAAA